MSDGASESIGVVADEKARDAVSEHVSGSWRRKGQSRAEGLVTGAAEERSPEDVRTHPWTPGLHMDVRARGALVSRDREVHRTVGHGGYANQVYGNRHVRSGFEHSVFSKDRTVVVQGMEGLGSDILRDVSFGRDRLDVAEDAFLEWKARTTLMSGTLTRRYLGGFIKAAPMEGVICGGALVRTIGGRRRTSPRCARATSTAVRRASRSPAPGSGSCTTARPSARPGRACSTGAWRTS